MADIWFPKFNKVEESLLVLAKQDVIPGDLVVALANLGRGLLYMSSEEFKKESDVWRPDMVDDVLNQEPFNESEA